MNKSTNKKVKRNLPDVVPAVSNGHDGDENVEILVHESSRNSANRTKRKYTTNSEKPRKRIVKFDLPSAEASEKVDDVDEERVDVEPCDNLQNSDENEVKSDIPSSILTDKRFTDIELTDKTRKGLLEMRFEFMTRVQNLAIPHLLAGRDAIISAKTGSGKTLAFLIPILETLLNAGYTRLSGTVAMIICPTRELALQTYSVLSELCEAGGHPHTHGLAIGGANRGTESDKLRKGINILICTPGRLLDHMTQTEGFQYSNLQILVVDEADRLLEDSNFERDMSRILQMLEGTKESRQTILFSATLTSKVKSLAKHAVNEDHVYFGTDDADEAPTVSDLEQGYVICPSEKRFLLLFTFLRRNRNKKIMVFLSSCNSVKFHAELLNFIDLPVLDIYGRQKQAKRTTTFLQFSKQTSGILLCTDVAARGWDIEGVDWIVQYDPPDDPKEYIHRVGRTCRGVSETEAGESKKGRALLFLLPEESGFLQYLTNARVPLNEYDFPDDKIIQVGDQLCRIIEANYYLYRSAREGYRSYLLSYASHSLKEIFDVNRLDLARVGNAFGFHVPPRVELGNTFRQDYGAAGVVSSSSSSLQSRRKKVVGDRGYGNSEMVRNKRSGHEFSASNPHGKRDGRDNRQFTR